MSRDRGEDAASGVTIPVFDDKPSLAFNPDVLGVDAFGVDDLRPPEILVGREGDDVFAEPGVGAFDFVEELCGETLSELVRFALRAARCGRGLMGRCVFSTGEVTAIIGLFCCSFFSSSEVLSLLRVPARGAGEGGLLACSTTADFGRYFGNADPTVVALADGIR